MANALDELVHELSAYESLRRAEAPIRTDAPGGTCTVFTYDDVATVLRDTDSYSNMPPGARYESQHAMLFTDPPHHRELRRLVQKAFTPGAIARLEGRLGEITDGLIAPVKGERELDFMRVIADPLPEIAIAEMLGLDPEAREAFKRWSRSFSIVVTSQARTGVDLGEHLDIVEDMFEYFDEIIADRRNVPRDDMITALVQAEEDGQRLSPEELRGSCAQLLAAGNETTTILLGNIMVCLAHRPSLVADLRVNRSLIPGVVDEVLRYLSPVQFVPRFCKRPVDLYGHHLEPGTPVLAMLASANRDENWFDEPNQFNHQRNPNRHLGFGFGIHFCLGAALARLEARVAIERSLDQLRGEWNVPDALERIPNEPFFFGFTSLPLTIG